MLVINPPQHNLKTGDIVEVSAHQFSRFKVQGMAYAENKYIVTVKDGFPCLWCHTYLAVGKVFNEHDQEQVNEMKVIGTLPAESKKWEFLNSHM